VKIKLLKYFVLIVVAALLVYNGIYIKKLDAKSVEAATNPDPVEFAQKFWTTKFTPYLDSAIELKNFVSMLKENPQLLFEKFSKTQGIGNLNYFIVKGEGVITAVNEDEIMVNSKTTEAGITIKLNTGIYFGNAIRDVTGMIKMGDFSNTMDYNMVSGALNKIVHTQIVLPLKSKAAKGTVIHFVGCAEIDKDQIITTGLQLLPVSIKNTQ
jgi:predicted lipoprotein